MYWDGDPESTFTEAYSSHDHWSSEVSRGFAQQPQPEAEVTRAVPLQSPCAENYGIAVIGLASCDERLTVGLSANYREEDRWRMLAYSSAGDYPCSSTPAESSRAMAKLRRTHHSLPSSSRVRAAGSCEGASESNPPRRAQVRLRGPDSQRACSIHPKKEARSEPQD
jgi:hypothetical protein